MRFRALIKDEGILKAVIDRILEGSIMLTNRELLALSPDLRKGVRELVATRQILEAGGKVVSRSSRMVGVVTDCAEGDKTEEPDDEMEMRSEEVFLQGGQAIVRIREGALALRMVPAIFEDTIELLCILD